MSFLIEIYLLMKIENEPLRMSPLSLSQIKLSGSILGIHSQRNFSLSDYQIQILEQMQKGQALSEIVRDLVGRGILPSFSGLRSLVQFMVEERLILNASFHQAFSPAPLSLKKTDMDFFESLSEKIFGGKEEFNLHSEISNIPFLRSIDPQIRELMIQNSKLIEAPAGTPICQEGQAQRSLFVLMRGQAQVLKRNLGNTVRKIAVLEQYSVFGEVGFFLGENRSADVVTTEKSLILRIKYLPQLYDTLIKSDKAKELQKRFWLVHALLKSQAFRDLPNDSFDALIFAGTLRTVSPQQIIIKEDDFGDTVYVVVQGNFVVSQKGRSLRILSQGDLFGEVALMLTGGRRSASVQAQTAGLCLEIPAARFYDLLAQNLWLACEFEETALARLKAVAADSPKKE